MCALSVQETALLPSQESLHPGDVTVFCPHVATDHAWTSNQLVYCLYVVPCYNPGVTTSAIYIQPDQLSGETINTSTNTKPIMVLTWHMHQDARDSSVPWQSISFF